RHDHAVLDADAAVLGQVHAGLDGDDRSRLEGISGGGGHRRGLVDVEAHAVAVECRKASAHPASAMSSRQAWSTSAQARPAVTAATPAAWLRATTSTMRLCTGSAGSPTQKVRVMSE